MKQMIKALFWATVLLAGVGAVGFLYIQYLDFFYDRYGTKGSAGAAISLVWVITVGLIYRAFKTKDKDNGS